MVGPSIPRQEIALHWCVGIARRAGWAGADTLVIPQSSGVIEAWAATMNACGVTEDQLATAIASKERLQVARWDMAEAQACKLVPEGLARKHHLFPLRDDDRSLVVAACDPLSVTADQEIGFASGRRPVFEVASPEAIRVAIEAGYAPENAAASLLARAAGTDLADLVRVAKQAAPEAIGSSDAAAEPVVGLANLILRDAVNARASDIHIEPGRPMGVVRFRVDGVMREYLQLPMPVFNRVVSRIKVMGGLDIADRMRPHDGRARIHLPDGKTVDLRLSTVPTRESEKCVIRILDSTMARTLDFVGLPPAELARVKQLIGNRDGIVLLTGPTGSGKTTTLYGAIRHLADGKVNITTIEDPVEYDVQGITQIQIENKREVTFASALRAVLRQDPDVVFVGEIRDGETASTAAQAALTGHLVLSTLHTNDAVGVIGRLADLGLDRATIGASLRGAVGQRLVRRLCEQCAVKVTDPLTPEETRLSAVTRTRPTRRAIGCERCAGSGYYGRVAVAEVFMNSPTIEAMIAKGDSLQTIMRQARAEGMRTLSEIALKAVTDGVTTLEDFERVIGLADFQTTDATRNVLVVDDDPVIRRLACACLAQQGFAHTESGDGEQGLAMALSGEALDLVILDLGLPGIGGREVLRRIRANQTTHRLPVIILTGASEEHLEVELMDEGADDYMRKPFDPAKLIARVNAVLRRAAQR